MKQAGIREFKNRLSEYVRLVREGEQILVTDRGRVVAELRQPTAELEHPKAVLRDLARQGKARLGAPNDPSLYAPLKLAVGLQCTAE